MATINCTIAGCTRAFHTNADLVDHAIAHHAAASSSSSSAAKLTRPSIDANSSPAAWAAFMVQFEDYTVCGSINTTKFKISELMRSIPKACFERMNEKYPAGGVYELSYNDAVKEAKKAVVSPETLSVRRANFLQIRQKDREAFVSSPAPGRRSSTPTTATRASTPPRRR